MEQSRGGFESTSAMLMRVPLDSVDGWREEEVDDMMPQGESSTAIHRASVGSDAVDWPDQRNDVLCVTEIGQSHGLVPAVKSVLVAAVDVAVDRGYASPR